eukprot:scaffold1120_cov447-Prasinococcus_capsulatus_cf.AAC.2
MHAMVATAWLSSLAVANLAAARTKLAAHFAEEHLRLSLAPILLVEGATHASLHAASRRARKQSHHPNVARVRGERPSSSSLSLRLRLLLATLVSMLPLWPLPPS